MKVEQEEIDYVKSLKRKFSLDQDSVHRLWEIHFKLFTAYPNYTKSNPCGSCLTNVLNTVNDEINRLIEEENNKKVVIPVQNKEPEIIQKKKGK